MSQEQLFTDSELRLYDETLAFLEGFPKPGDGASDALALNFVKVVNDCRAILLLAQHGFYIQAGIVARSTWDACNLIMHIGAEGDQTAVVRGWLAGRPVVHWTLLERLNQRLRREELPLINVEDYRQVRRRLDDQVHANYEALKLYPAQVADSTPGDSAFHELTFWKSLVRLYLIVCLLIVRLMTPALDVQAAGYLVQLLSEPPGRNP